MFAASNYLHQIIIIILRNYISYVLLLFWYIITKYNSSNNGHWFIPLKRTLLRHCYHIGIKQTFVIIELSEIIFIFILLTKNKTQSNFVSCHDVSNVVTAISHSHNLLISPISLVNISHHILVLLTRKKQKKQKIFWRIFRLIC